MSNHTPGPWACSVGAQDALITSGDDVIAVVSDSLSLWREDARLIAAAPELLAALQRAAAILGRYPKHDDAFWAARAAIERATK
jgi:hypothetical protein